MDAPIPRVDPTKSWLVATGAMICMIAGSVPLSGLSFFHPYLFATMGAAGAGQAQILFYFTLWIIFASSTLLGVVHGAAQIVAPYLSYKVTAAAPLGLAQPLSFYSLLMSIWTIALVVMKPLLGFLNDRIGVIAAYGIALAVQSGFFLYLPQLAAFGTVIPVVMMLFMSAGMATGTVQPPLVTARAMGPASSARSGRSPGPATCSAWLPAPRSGGCSTTPPPMATTLGFTLAPLALAVVLLGSWVGLTRGRAAHLAQNASWDG